VGRELTTTNVIRSEGVYKRTCPGDEANGQQGKFHFAEIVNGKPHMHLGHDRGWLIRE